MTVYKEQNQEIVCLQGNKYTEMSYGNSPLHWSTVNYTYKLHGIFCKINIIFQQYP